MAQLRKKCRENEGMARNGAKPRRSPLLVLSRHNQTLYFEYACSVIAQDAVPAVYSGRTCHTLTGQVPHFSR